MRKEDKYGRLLETDERSFRPLDGEDISDESRECLKSDISDIQDEATKEALKDIYHILTGENI